MVAFDFQSEFSVCLKDQSGKQSSCDCSDKKRSRGIRPDTIVEGANEVMGQQRVGVSEKYVANQSFMFFPDILFMHLEILLLLVHNSRARIVSFRSGFL